METLRLVPWRHVEDADVPTWLSNAHALPIFWSAHSIHEVKLHHVSHNVCCIFLRNNWPYLYTSEWTSSKSSQLLNERGILVDQGGTEIHYLDLFHGLSGGQQLLVSLSNKLHCQIFVDSVSISFQGRQFAFPWSSLSSYKASVFGKLPFGGCSDLAANLHIHKAASLFFHKGKMGNKLGLTQ